MSARFLLNRLVTLLPYSFGRHFLIQDKLRRIEICFEQDFVQRFFRRRGHGRALMILPAINAHVTTFGCWPSHQ